MSKREKLSKKGNRVENEGKKWKRGKIKTNEEKEEGGVKSKIILPWIDIDSN